MMISNKNNCDVGRLTQKMTNSDSNNCGTRTKSSIDDDCCLYPSHFRNNNNNTNRNKRKICDITTTIYVNEPKLQEICYDQLSYYNISIIIQQLLFFLPNIQYSKFCLLPRQQQDMYIGGKESVSIQKTSSIRIRRGRLKFHGTNHNYYSQTFLYIFYVTIYFMVTYNPIIISNNSVYSFQHPIVTTTRKTICEQSGRCNSNSILVGSKSLQKLTLSSSLLLSLSSSNSNKSYENYTVKELRQLVKDLPSLERGILSKLTKKKDLISYLMNNANVNSINTLSVLASPSEEQEKDVIQQRRQKTVVVIEQQIEDNPKIVKTRSDPSTTTTTTGSSTNGGKAAMTSSSSPMSRMAPMMIQQQQRQTMSAKDTIIEEVLIRYPPVREQYAIKLQNQQQQQLVDDEECIVVDNNDDSDDDECVTNSAVLSTVDVRQQYHPIFRKLVTSTSSKNIASSSSAGTIPKLQEEDDKVEIDNDATPTSKVASSSSMFTSSDMDLIFVGTASCTPGITRGTSCTALRLNWQQRTSTTSTTGGTTAKQRPTSNVIRNGKAQQQQQNVQSYTTNSVGTSGTWLFDVGECTQLQIQRTTSIKPSKITKIFLTHAHGDHSFGLPGLLCVMGNGNQNRDLNMQNNNNNNNNGDGQQQQPIEIYGPEGLRMWLRVAIRYSVSRIVPQYVVHELMDLPMAPEWEFNRRFKRYYYNGFQQQQHSTNHKDNNIRSPIKGPWGSKGLAGEDPTNWISQAKDLRLDPSPLYGEVDGGRSIYPDYNHPKANDGAPVWTLIEDETVTVSAAPMSHTIPCVGYCIEEAQRPGRLRNEIVEPIVQRNLELLRSAGLKNPMKVMGILKNLQPDTAFTFPDGTVVTQKDAVEAARKGRKVVICGDTCDSRAMIKLGQDADVVVHEATNSYLPGVDTKRDITYNDVTRDCIIHGHSTPQMAGEFCKKINGKQLILNHFSARYKGDVSAESLSIMMRIERLAIQPSGLDESNVAAAWDFMILPIQQRE